MFKKAASTVIALACCINMNSANAMGEEPASTGYTETENPIVMVNGIYGFDTAIGVMDYWYGITDAMEDDGATVYAANVQATGSTEDRGEQLIDFLENLKAVHGHQQFNLVGHSYGGITARYVASTRPDLVVSISTMGTPHKGTDLADGLADIDNQSSILGKVIFGLGDVGAFLIDLLSGHPDPTSQDTRTTAYTMTSAFMSEWNQSFPAGIPTSACGEGNAVDGGIHYYSMGGVAQRTHALDIIGDTIVAVAQTFFDHDDHDGLVNRCSTHIGQVIRDDYYLNHVDQINHILGLRGRNSPDPKEIFRTHANRLKQAGL